MERYKFDESNGLWYERSGDYYLPLLALPPQEDKPIGIWGCGSPVATSVGFKSAEAPTEPTGETSDICAISGRINERFIPR